MTDAELLAWWPDLGNVVIALRRLNYVNEADLLLDAVAAGATSTEVLGSIGVILLRSGKLRSELTPQHRVSWDRVMADINHAYPPSFRFNRWLARIDRDLKWPPIISKWAAALALAGLLFAMIWLAC